MANSSSRLINLTALLEVDNALAHIAYLAHQAINSRGALFPKVLDLLQDRLEHLLCVGSRDVALLLVLVVIARSIVIE